MNKLISSQRYLDDDVVSQKLADCDYVVTVYTVTVDGVDYDVVVDGHHSLEAAKLAGVEPEFHTVGREIASEYDYAIETAGVDAWLADHTVDSDWYEIATGVAVF